MSTRPLPSPPRDAFSVWQRLLRGYGPLAVFAVLLLVMALAVPSKPQTVSTGGSGGQAPTTDDTTTDTSGDTTGTSLGALPGTPGATGAAAGTGAKGLPATGKAKGVVTACTGRTEQVPGDPYSPPCVAFTGDNGAATSRGVNATEIHIAYRELNEKGFQQTLAALAGAQLQDGPADIHRTVEALAEYFSKRFQMYGRKLVIDFYPGKGSNTTELLGGGRDNAEADAERVLTEKKSFGDLSATSEPYAGALAKRKVMGFGDPYLSRPWHDQHAPYIWSIATDGTLVANEAAEYTGKRLCAKNATFAGGALKDKQRVIATFAPENPWYQESVTIARDTLSQYKGCQLAPPVAYQLDLGTMSNQAQNIIPRMKNAGVTTILCGCDPIMPVFLTGEMNRENYYPEFVIVGTALTDTDIVGQLWDPKEAPHAFGVSSLQAPVPPTQTVAYEAYKKVRNDEPAFTVDLIYYQMEMLAIGIQMAGPNLTPQTFEQGMFKYPPKLGPVGYWTFAPHDYTAANDVREIYWSGTATSGYNGKKGAFVEPQPGVRWRQGQIPAGDPNFPAAP
jgi:hypothetical protein